MNSGCRSGYIALLAPSVLATLLVLVATQNYGVGVSPDSVAYISAARELLAGNGYISYDGEPLISWPPAFPTLIALPGIFGADPLDAARYVNALLFGLIVFSGSVLLKKNLKDARLIVVGVMSLLLSEPLLRVCTRAWTEPMFILLTILFVGWMQRFLETERARDLVVAAILAALALLTRYAGITVVLAGVATLILRREIPVRTRLLQSTAFVTIGLMPVMIWLIRNVLISGSLTGPRPSAEFEFFRTAGHLVGTISEWFLPSIVGIILLGFVMARSHGPSVMPSRTGRRQQTAVLFTIIYVVVLLASATFVGHDRLDHRLLSPIYFPLLLLLLSYLDRGRGMPAGKMLRMAPVWSVVAVGLWLIWPCIDTTLRVRDYWQNGIPTYSTRAWHESQLMAFLAHNPQSGSIYSNAPDAIYIRTGRRAVFSPLKDDARALENSGRGLAMLTESVNSDSAVHLAWFAAVHRPYLFTVGEMRSACEFAVVDSFADGALYRLRPAQMSPQ